MHESTLVRSLLSKAESEAAAHGASGVNRVFLRVGRATGVDLALLHAAWEGCRRNTHCAAAELSVDVVPTRWACPACGSVPEPTSGRLTCPLCGDPLHLESGEEMILDRIELEVGDDVRR